MLSEPYDIDPFCLSPLTLCAGRMQAVLEGTPIYRSSVYTCYQYSLILSILYVLVFFCSKILPCFRDVTSLQGQRYIYAGEHSQE